MRFPFLFFALGSSLLAQSGQPIDTNAMLSNLQQLRTKHDQSAHSQISQTIRDFSSAAATPDSALAFYLQAVQITQFAGDSKQGTEFRDWKKKEGDRLKGPGLPMAMRICLSYMALSMQRVAGSTNAQLLPALLNYTAQTQAAMATIYDQKIIKEPVSGNLFARWYGFGGPLGGLEEWEQSPGDIESIYAQSILPVMRKTHDPRILQYWDDKIAREAAGAAGAKAFDADVFANTRKPRLFWSRAEDMLAIGQRNPALTEMYTVIKNYPNHPDTGKWMDELQGLLVPSSTSGTSAPASPVPE